MVNLSSTIISNTEASVLALGKKFISKPPRINQKDLTNTFNDFARRIKLTYFFYDSEDKDNNNRFNIKSNWNPPEHRISNGILQNLSQLREKLKNISLTNFKCSRSKFYHKTLNKLSQNPDIIFKPADKGSSIIISDKVDYVKEAERQLDNQLHYKKLEQPVYPLIKNRINDLLSKIHRKKLLTKKELSYFKVPSESRSRIFYLLPKIHKDISKWTNGRIPPGRPIVSDCSSDTYNLSNFIDYYLQPLSTKHPAYIKDTPHFIEKMRSFKCNKEFYLITLDVESLYTNIDNSHGLQAVRELLSQNPDPSRPDEEFLEFLELCLKNNDFVFNKKWFLQLWGTSMGKKFAPAYANIFMAYFEQCTLPNCSKLPEMYVRFLDDIFMIWTHSLQDFDDFLSILNNSHPTIKFKATISKTSIEFLDVTIYKGDNFRDFGILDTKVYFKPTDTHELLHKLSYHPKHTFKGILKSQVLRFKRICNNDSDFELACHILFKSLRERQYSRRLLRTIKSQTIRELNNLFFNIGISRPCGKLNCSMCPLYVQSKSYIQNHRNFTFPLKQALNCSSRNVIYCIQCNSCSKQYVGQTKNSIRERISQHRSDLRLNKHTQLTKHFSQCLLRRHCSVQPDFIDFSVTVLQQLPILDDPDNNRAELLKAESTWMTTLDTTGPFGLNSRKEAPPPIPLILRYSDQTHNISTLFRQHYSQLQTKFPNIFRAQLITAHSRNKNIQDKLISSEFS